MLEFVRMPPPAIILLSGGLDSATVLALARSRGHPCLAITFDYGQRHRHEIDAARAVAAALGAEEHRVIRLDPRAFAGSALTSGRDGRWEGGAGPGSTARAAGSTDRPAPAVPKNRNDAAMGDGIPITYVPARNLVFLSMAVATAESIGARDIYIGVNAVDYSGYPDCRPAFIAAMQEAARLGTKAGVEAEVEARVEAGVEAGVEARIKTGSSGRVGATSPRSGDDIGIRRPITIHDPLVTMSKAAIIRLGVSLGVDYGLTISCYDPAGTAERPLSCGACDACVLRRKGFAAAGVADPTRYVQ